MHALLRNTIENEKMKNRMNCLPPELLFEVLTHLPATDLLKLRVVCKLWNSIICDRSFHQHHLHQLRKKNIHGCKFNLITHSLGSFRSVDIKCSETLATIEEIELCKSHYDGAINYIMACVDGVLLANTVSYQGNDYVNVIFLWNPTLRKVVDIPLYGPLKKVCYDVQFGFGFDSVSNIYKVVAIYSEKNELKIMVYNLGSRSWTSPKVDRGSIDNVKHSPYSRSLNFEGCIYWLSKIDRGSIDKANKAPSSSLNLSNNHTRYCLCFNLSTEALTCAKLPDLKCDDGKISKYAPIRHAPIWRCLAVLYESLALVDGPGGGGSHGYIRVWMRRKDSTTSSEISWVQLYNLDCNGKHGIYLANNGNLYLGTWSIPQTTSVYDLKAGKEKFYSGTYWNINIIDAYLPSLTLLR